MFIPNKVTINARDINVVKSKEPFRQVAPDSFVLGYYSPRNGEIGIYDNINNPSVTEALFFHEVIEAIDMHGDIGLDHNSITILGNGIHQVVQQLLKANIAPSKSAFDEAVAEMKLDKKSKAA